MPLLPMRYVTILLIAFREAAEYRSRALVWFLISLIGPMLFLLFWMGKLQASGGTFLGWEFSSITSYYFLLLMLGTFLMSHVEERIAREDIAQGGLDNYLTKPISYFWIKFLREFPYKCMQGFLGSIVFFLFVIFFPNLVVLTNSFPAILLSLAIIGLAFLLCFVLKMIVGIFSFWLIDIGGFFQLVEAIIFVFGGYILPIELLPGWVAFVAKILPFAYIIYYPVVALQGNLSVVSLSFVILMQCIWLFILFFLYQYTWSLGLKRFAGVGK